MVAIATRREKCARCGKVISRRHVPSVWHDHIVCDRCHCKLRALEPAMALSKGVRPELRYAKHSNADPSTSQPGHVLGRWVTVIRRTLHLPRHRANAAR
jgi:hypothetical protein